VQHRTEFEGVEHRTALGADQELDLVAERCSSAAEEVLEDRRSRMVEAGQALAIELPSLAAAPEGVAQLEQEGQSEAHPTEVEEERLERSTELAVEVARA
jgi:hypothetical protein